MPNHFDQILAVWNFSFLGSIERILATEQGKQKTNMQKFLLKRFICSCKE